MRENIALQSVLTSFWDSEGAGGEQFLHFSKGRRMGFEHNYSFVSLESAFEWCLSDLVVLGVSPELTDKFLFPLYEKGLRAKYKLVLNLISLKFSKKQK